MKDENIIITHPKPEDVHAMQNVLHLTWLATYPNKGLGITTEDIEDRFKNRFTKEALAKRAEEIANPAPGNTQFIAKDGERIVGICRITVDDEKNQLRAIYVLPEYQHKGIGMRFWEEANKFFDPEKNTIVQVATYNTNAINFYKKLGFEDTGKRFSDKRFIMKSGTQIPEMEMIIRAKK